jgi:hypothetical protein
MKFDKTRPIRAYVVLKGAKGSLTTGTVSSENVQHFIVDRSIQEGIGKTLKKLGFSVSRFGPFSITIQALPAHFEAIFQAPLHTCVYESPGISPVTILDWERSPIIPEELGEVIDAVVFPQEAVATHAEIPR